MIGPLLNVLFGPTWDEVKTWDDVVPLERRDLLKKLIKENEGKESCPYLNRNDEIFLFCQGKAALLTSYSFTDIPSPTSAQYHAQVDHFELQLWCMQPKERYCNCIDFQDAKEKIIDVDKI